MSFRGDHDSQVVALGDDEMLDVVEELAIELETFAFERERILAKLDIRSAAHARRTAREVRLIADRIADASDPAAREPLLDQLGDHFARAHTLLECGTSEMPGRPREGDPPMPSNRDAQTSPPPVAERKVQVNQRPPVLHSASFIAKKAPGRR